MKITIAKTAGFCFGVKRAYDLACVNSKDCEKLYILGKLVHNDDVCRDLYKRGIKEIKSLDDIKEGTVIFTAHGVGPCLYEKASEKGIKIIDTTCPKVMKAQRLAKIYAEKKFQVLIFGDRDHKEVKSIREWTRNKGKVIGSADELSAKGGFASGGKKIKLEKSGKYCLVSQTTQNMGEFKKIIAWLKKNIKNFMYFNTICPSTNDRQKEVKELARRNDVVVVIGGRDSANSRRLFEISKKLNRNSYFIENAKQLKKSWINGIKKIAISAGASTPDWVIREVVDKIRDDISSTLEIRSRI
jgi:(E)-4-hydroxy-3-methyl-but-2-enyl pyrophosphate reductase